MLHGFRTIVSKRRSLGKKRLYHAACKVPGCVQARAVRKLLAHRLSGESAERAKAEWYEVVEGDHSLWDGVSEPYKHTIRAFLVYFHTQIQRHSTERFNFRNGSVGAHHPVLARPVPARPFTQARDALHGLLRATVSTPSKSSLHRAHQQGIEGMSGVQQRPLHPTLTWPLQGISSLRGRACSSGPWRQPSSCSAAWRASLRARWCFQPSARRSASPWALRWPMAQSSAARTRSAILQPQVRPSCCAFSHSIV